MITYSIDETKNIAGEIALTPGLVIALIGGLGAGKTTFVQGLAGLLNCKDYVVSPTFTLVNEYLQCDIPIYHIDLYRLQNLEDALSAGLHEYIPAANGITVVEWADQIPQLLPDNYTEVTIKVIEEGVRDINIVKVCNE